LAADENWVWRELSWSITEPEKNHEYRWPSWDWDAIVGKDWFDTMHGIYWGYWGWTGEPVITGNPLNDDWPAPTDGYTLDVSPDSQTVLQGEAISYTVNLLDPNDDFSNLLPIEVRDTTLPPGTTATFLPDNSCVPDCSRTLVISTSASTPAGTYTPRVRVLQSRSGLAQRYEDVTLVVTGSATLADAIGAMSAEDQEGLTVQGVGDYGVDLDGDGYYDQLVIELEINAARAGSYGLMGQLGVEQYAPTLMGTGGIVAETIARADLAQGANRVQLVFDGLHISAAKVDGPYVLDYLSITDVVDPGRDDFIVNALDHWNFLYTTGAYGAYDFQNRGAGLTYDITETGQDADGDGLYEALTLNVGLKVVKPDTYTVRGSLYDSRDRFVGEADWTGTGSTASLQFDVAGTTGPYTLRELTLLNAEGQSIDATFEAYTTQQVVKAEIKTHIVEPADLGEVESEAILPGPYSDAGIDTDGDGKYDQLRITASLTIEDGEGGQAYRIEGWLVDTHGALVAWAVSNSQVLNVGTHTMNLAFDGRMINEHGVDGPFTLVALKILPGGSYSVLDEVPVAHTTSSYNHDDFEVPLDDPDVSTIFWDDMESGAGQWSAGSYWDLSQNKWHSYSHSWEADMSGSRTNDLTTIGLDAPADLDLTLRFRTCYAMGSTGDVGRLQASINGGEWTNLDSYTTPGWNTEFLDLTQFQGASGLRLRFRAASQSEVLWYIDDVAVISGRPSEFTYLPVVLK